MENFAAPLGEYELPERQKSYSSSSNGVQTIVTMMKREDLETTEPMPVAVNFRTEKKLRRPFTEYANV